MRWSPRAIVRAGILSVFELTLSGAVFAAPLKVAMYADEGVRGAAAVRWAEILGDSPEVELKLVKGADIRSGALDDRELLVMPGGAGGPQYAALGDEGAEKVRDFVAAGGRYLGTCCGMAIALNEEVSFAKRLKMLPLKHVPPVGRGEMTLDVVFTAEGAKTLGVVPEGWNVRYHNGPVVEPAEAVPACSSCETLATVRGGPLAGVPAVVKAQYGRGTMLVFNCHPESKSATEGLVIASIRLLTGRTITLAEPCKRVLKGPHPLLVTPFNEDATVDVPVLLKEADYLDAQGVGGMIWPTAGELQGIVASGSYEPGLRALAEHAAKRNYHAKIVAICSGTNSTQEVELASQVDAIARATGATMAILARPPDNATNQTMIVDHYRAMAKVTTLPVIIQTYNGKSPQPEISTLVSLFKEFPLNYGYVKEESPGLTVNDRMRELLKRPETKGVFSGWGGKGWVYQGSRIGTIGVISQRPAYASLFVKVCDRLAAGADASDPELADAYAKYLYMANLGDIFSKWGDDEMRGPHLYVLQRLGIFRNRLSLVDKGKVGEYEMSEDEKREVEARMRYCGLKVCEGSDL